jgi:DNA-binding NtrC family response regulator
LREQLFREPSATAAELLLYEDALLFYLYYRYHERIAAAAFDQDGKNSARWRFYKEFQDEWRHYFESASVEFPTGHEPAHTFACYYQIARAFRYIFESIIGESSPAARLRASIWQSIFTRDMRRYRQTLYNRMGDFATLITGPSGSGKELVARALALSRYVPFDTGRQVFTVAIDDCFHPINIAALPATLVESELFGHRRGAFTGAISDRRGRLEVCPPLGAVFLDEIGDLEPEIQVKLLRVIETRVFQPLGDVASQRFKGKLMAATNRDLAEAIDGGGFRADLYYRLCSDQIETPPLSLQLRESPEVLSELVLFMAQRVAGAGVEDLASEAEEWILDNLGPDYPWPGNYRELEQCVRNLIIRRDYRPAARTGRMQAAGVFAEALEGSLTAEELLRRYCTLVYHQTGNYQEAARRLQLDRRTVKAKVDQPLLESLRSDPPAST